MLAGETIREALGSIRANKMRAALTMVGIVIGVAAVITVVEMGSGAQKAVQDRINALGASLITINPGMGRGKGGAATMQRAPMYVDDADSLAAEARVLTYVVHEMSRDQQVVFETRVVLPEIVTSQDAVLQQVRVDLVRRAPDAQRELVEEGIAEA